MSESDPEESPAGASGAEPWLRPKETIRVNVPNADYPSEVTCRVCRNLMLPDDLRGTSWTCWVCSRRIVVVPKASGEA